MEQQQQQQQYDEQTFEATQLVLTVTSECHVTRETQQVTRQQRARAAAAAAGSS
jgi:hypothetical protein